MPKVILVLSLLFSLLIITNLSIANVAEDGLVAYWPFDEGDGKKADRCHGQRDMTENLTETPSGLMENSVPDSNLTA